MQQALVSPPPPASITETAVRDAFRTALAKAFGRDLPAALIEDLVAIGGAYLIVHGL